MMTISLAGSHGIAIVVQKTEVEHQIAGCHCHYGLLSPSSRLALALRTLKEQLCELRKNFGN
jgi:hypothetical protein